MFLLRRRKIQQHSIVRISEPNLNCNKRRIKEKTRETFHNTYVKRNLWTALSPIPPTRTHKTGEILPMSSRLLTSRTVSKGRDHLGRWECIVIKREEERRLCIMQAYILVPRNSIRLFFVTTRNRNRK